MERQRQSIETETDESEGDLSPVPADVVPPIDLEESSSRARTSSEEELTLLSQNADPNVQDPHDRESMFWPPTPPSAETLPPRNWGSVVGNYLWHNIPPRRVRQNRPWVIRDRFLTPHVVNHQLPYLYYRQYMRQEVLRSYMSPGHRLPMGAQFLNRHEPPSLARFPVYAACFPVPGRPGLRRAYVIPQTFIRHVPHSDSSNSSSANSPSPLNLEEGNEDLNFAGLDEPDILNNTQTLYNPDNSEQTTCVICMSPCARSELLRKLPCRHMFHKECIDTWFGYNRICPTCRRCVQTRRHPSPSA